MKWESMDKCLCIENVVRVYLMVHPAQKKEHPCPFVSVARVHDISNILKSLYEGVADLLFRSKGFDFNSFKNGRV